MANLLDLMTDEDRQRAEAAYKKRMGGDGSYRKEKVSPVMYLIAEVGTMFGWGAIEAAKRGYVLAETDDGKRYKIPLTMEELSALADAGRKIKYADLVNQARGVQVATGSVLSKHPKESFARGIKPFAEKVRE